MKLLVVAQTPPPLHGQSLMVKTLLDGLPARGIEVCHVPLQLSSASQDIGRWQPAKVVATIRAAFAARHAAGREKPDTLYYVPAPAKRGALYRDLVIMSLCRSLCSRLVLHWHAPGLGAWAQARATAIERSLAQRALGRADLSLALSAELAIDAAIFQPRSTLIVANGVRDPGACPPRAPRAGRPCELLFLGLGSEAKGLFTTIAALKRIHAARPGSARLTFAGNFGAESDRRRFQQEQKLLGGDRLQDVGFADEAAKRALFARADIFCFPTSYPHEGQPLVLMEALAHDLPIVTSPWRGIPAMLPAKGVRLVPPQADAATAEAMLSLWDESPPAGTLRQHYLAYFTLEQHLKALAEALHTLD